MIHDGMETHVMIESPFLAKLLADHPKVVEKSPVYQLLQKETHGALIDLLIARFKTVPEKLQASIGAIRDPEKLRELFKQAALCPSIKEFRKHLKS